MYAPAPRWPKTVIELSARRTAPALLPTVFFTVVWERCFLKRTPTDLLFFLTTTPDSLIRVLPQRNSNVIFSLSWKSYPAYSCPSRRQPVSERLPIMPVRRCFPFSMAAGMGSPGQKRNDVRCSIPLYYHTLAYVDIAPNVKNQLETRFAPGQRINSTTPTASGARSSPLQNAAVSVSVNARCAC